MEYKILVLFAHPVYSRGFFIFFKLHYQERIQESGIGGVEDQLPERQRGVAPAGGG